jgi:deoxyribodipyrimidine photo-lyase
LSDLAHQTGAEAIVWNRCYEPWRIARDANIKSALKGQGLDVQSFNGSLLWEPWQVLKKDSTPYKVFTPYYRRGCLSAVAPRQPISVPISINISKTSNHSLRLEDLNLLPKINWDKEMDARWDISEAAAHTRLDEFVMDDLQDYREGRNFPNKPNVSRLSPYLHFGQISPNIAWHRASEAGAFVTNEQSLDTFLSELGWREFSSYLLYHFPKLPTDNLQARFDLFPWAENTDADLKAWQRGNTGYPLVDAGMRELYSTGYMHNRVRMVVGSFLVKNLLVHWHHGERWFWDCLVDADLASNSASWQWIAGCGADAAPFFRIFNPITQSEKFDKQGAYIRRYVPEIANLPDKYIHAPWLAPSDVLSAAGVGIGIDYPAPIIDIKESRERALAAFAVTKIKPSEV